MGKYESVNYGGTLKLFKPVKLTRWLKRVPFS